MKKIIALMLIILAFSCEKKHKESENSIEIDLENLTPESGAVIKVWENEGPEGEWILYVAREFEKKYPVKVIHEPIRMVDTLTRLYQDGPAGTGADIIVLPHNRIGEAIISGLLMPNVISYKRIKDEFLSSATNAITWQDGNIWAFPLAIETYVLFYNKDLIGEIKSFEELLKWNREKNFTNKNTNHFALMWEIGNLYYTHAFLLANGGYLFGNNGNDKNDIGILNKKVYEALENMLALKEISSENPIDVSYDAMMGLFREGKIATIINGPWAIQGLEEAGVNFGMVKLPSLKGKKLKPFSGIRVMGVSSYTKYPIAAQMFADFASSLEMLKERYLQTKQIPPLNNIEIQELIKDDEKSNIILKQAKESVAMPIIPQMALMWDPLSNAITDVWTGKSDAKTALESQIKIVKEQIDLQEK